MAKLRYANKKGLLYKQQTLILFNSKCLVCQSSSMSFPGYRRILTSQVFTLYESHCAPYMVQLNTLNAFVAFACQAVPTAFAVEIRHDFRGDFGVRHPEF